MSQKQVMQKSEDLSRSLEINAIWTFDLEFGSICKAVRRDMDAFARSLTSSTDIKTPAILHGQKYELVAVRKENKNFPKWSVCVRSASLPGSIT